MNSYTGRFHLSESRDPVPHVWENGGLVTHLEVKVDGLMREGGELITEAKPVDALGLCLVREAVILLLGLPVDDVAPGVFHIAVHIVVASSDNLVIQRELHALLHLFVEALLGVVRQLEGELSAPQWLGPEQEQKQQL